jgi:hypothetical protein
MISAVKQTPPVVRDFLGLGIGAIASSNHKKIEFGADH